MDTTRQGREVEKKSGAGRSLCQVPGSAIRQVIITVLGLPRVLQGEAV